MSRILQILLDIEKAGISLLSEQRPPIVTESKKDSDSTSPAPFLSEAIPAIQLYINNQLGLSSRKVVGLEENERHYQYSPESQKKLVKQFREDYLAILAAEEAGKFALLKNVAKLFLANYERILRIEGIDPTLIEDEEKVLPELKDDEAASFKKVELEKSKNEEKEKQKKDAAFSLYQSQIGDIIFPPYDFVVKRNALTEIGKIRYQLGPYPTENRKKLLDMLEHHINDAQSENEVFEAFDVYLHIIKTECYFSFARYDTYGKHPKKRATLDYGGCLPYSSKNVFASYTEYWLCVDLLPRLSTTRYYHFQNDPLYAIADNFVKRAKAETYSLVQCGRIDTSGYYIFDIKAIADNKAFLLIKSGQKEELYKLQCLILNDDSYLSQSYVLPTEKTWTSGKIHVKNTSIICIFKCLQDFHFTGFNVNLETGEVTIIREDEAVCYFHDSAVALNDYITLYIDSNDDLPAFHNAKTKTCTKIDANNNSSLITNIAVISDTQCVFGRENDHHLGIYEYDSAQNTFCQKSVLMWRDRYLSSYRQFLTKFPGGRLMSLPCEHMNAVRVWDISTGVLLQETSYRWADIWSTVPSLFPDMRTILCMRNSYADRIQVQQKQNDGSVRPSFMMNFKEIISGSGETYSVNMRTYMSAVDYTPGDTRYEVFPSSGKFIISFDNNKIYFADLKHIRHFREYPEKLRAVVLPFLGQVSVLAEMVLDYFFGNPNVMLSRKSAVTNDSTESKPCVQAQPAEECKANEPNKSELVRLEYKDQGLICSDRRMLEPDQLVFDQIEIYYQKILSELNLKTSSQFKFSYFNNSSLENLAAQKLALECFANLINGNADALEINILQMKQNSLYNHFEEAAKNIPLLMEKIKKIFSMPNLNHKNFSLL